MTLQNLQAEFIELLSSHDVTEAISPCANLSVYENNIHQTLIHFLQSIYPLIHTLVGDDFFRASAKVYLENYPSRSSNLLDYGEYFGYFLSEYEPALSLIYLPEVAKFEWICHELSFAPDHEAFDINTLENLKKDQYDQLHFLLHPASHVIHFHYPLLRIIDLCQGKSDETIDIDEGGVSLLMIRRSTDISLVKLSMAEYTFLQALSNGKTLSEATSNAIVVDANFNLEEKLPQWIQNKTLVDCYLDSTWK